MPDARDRHSDPFLYSVHGLRFVAAAFVVFAHSRWELGLSDIGAFGVDIFFVISGFIISHVTAHDPSRFLIKRIIRIVPLYWFATLSLSVVALAAPHLLNSARFDAERLVSSLFFIPYWNPSTEFAPILKLGWTLNLEMFFYLLFWVSMQISHAHREAVCGLFLVILASLHSLFAETSAFRFLTTPIVIEFAFGMAMAVMWRNLKHPMLPAAGALPLAVLCAASLVAITLHTGTVKEWGVPRFIYFGLPSALLFWAALSCEPFLGTCRERAKDAIRMLGDISYSVYLIHIYVIAALHRVLGFDFFGMAAPFFLLSLALVSALSLLSFRFVERPSRRYLMAFFRPAERPRRQAAV